MFHFIVNKPLIGPSAHNNKHLFMKCEPKGWSSKKILNERCIFFIFPFSLSLSPSLSNSPILLALSWNPFFFIDIIKYIKFFTFTFVFSGQTSSFRVSDLQPGTEYSIRYQQMTLAVQPFFFLSHFFFKYKIKK